MRQPFPGKDFVTLGDGAPAYTRKGAREDIAKHKIRFLGAQRPASPDLNVPDHHLWAEMQRSDTEQSTRT